MQPGKVGSRRILIWQRRTLKKSSALFAQAHFQYRGRAKAQHALITLGEKLLRVEVIRIDLFEARTGEAVANAAGHFAQVEAFAGGIGWTEQALQPALQILRADQEWLGARLAKFNQTNGGT